MNCSSSGSSPFRWFKGNLHAHTDLSDGRLPPVAVVDWYAGRGYDFLAITDHGRLTSFTPRGRGILMIPGAEITAYDEPAKTFYHFVALTTPGGADPLPRPGTRSPQAVVDQLNEAGAMVIQAHPYWLGLSSAQLRAIQGTVGIEVYNHHCELGVARGYSEVHWDELLLGGQVVWGLACDDSHWRDKDAGGGWIMVRARRLAVDEILAAIRAGEFYATQGPEIHRWAIEPSPAGSPDTPGRVVVECSPCSRVVFLADRWLGLVVEAGGRGEEPLSRAVYQLTGKETYVRAVCVDASGRKAWSQPLFLTNGPDDKQQQRGSNQSEY